MRALFYSLLGYFLTPVGVLLMAALDSSMVFFLPLGIDFIVIIMTARKPELFWLYAILATIGSLVGASLTFWIGRKVGEHGLHAWSNRRGSRNRTARRANGRRCSVGALAIIPPPFPFTAFVLASGALHANAWHFLVTLAGVRLVRFLVEGALAAHYGRGIISWMKSPPSRSLSA